LLQDIEEKYQQHIKVDVEEEHIEIFEDTDEALDKPSEFDEDDCVCKVTIRKPSVPVSGGKWFNFVTQQYEDIPDTLDSKEVDIQAPQKMSYSRWKNEEKKRA